MHTKTDNVKKILAYILTAVILLSAVSFSVYADIVNPFSDITSSEYYYDAVIWAYESGITTGVSATRFAPASTTTRGQVVTFLWRALGEPEPETRENPFEDVNTSDYFYKAVLWAVEEGITNGTSAKRFSPAVTCTNAHILTFIWRAMGEPEKTGDGEWYEDAVNWAEGAGMTEGTYEGTFDPQGPCPRANVVTYLYKYDKTDSSILRIFVSSSGNDATADGTASKPFATIAAAKEYVKTLDKSNYSNIIVKIKSGEYSLKEPIVFTDEDSGTESCQISYIGESGATIIGGVSLKSDNFISASGELTKYFPESSRDKIVMLNLLDYGYTEEDIANMYDSIILRDNAPMLYVAGELQNIARYPNDTMEYIESGAINTELTNGRGEYLKDTITVTMNEEFMARAKTWTSGRSIYTDGRMRFLWRPDRSRVISFDFSNNTFDIVYDGAYAPQDNMPVYFYNIPEELDIPGEYFIDTDGMLYYYPTDDFYKGTVSLSGDSSFVELQNVSYVSFKNMLIESFSNSFDGQADNISIIGCTIRNSTGSAVTLDGMKNLISDCEMYNLPHAGILLKGGDNDKLILSETLVYNCVIHDWGLVQGLYEEAVEANGTGITVSHCTMYNAPHEAYTWNGAYNIFEYNEVYNVCTQSSDAGALYSGMSYADFGSEIRFNYIHDVGLSYEPYMNIEGFDDYGCHAIYWDDGESFQSAYGNVIENVKGVGVFSTGRNEVITGNLFISCGYAMDVENRFYAGRFSESGSSFGIGGQGQFKVYGMENKEAWKTACPELYEISWDVENAQPDDPYYFGCPGFITIKNNYVYYDKANAKGANWGIRPYNVDKTVYSMNDVEDPVNGKTMTLYSSKRTPVDVLECVVNSQSVTGITPEIFASIGSTLAK